jgi:hypothetical protein
MSHIDCMSAKALNRQGVNLVNSGDADGALIVFLRAVKVDPKLSLAHNNTGIIYYQKGRYDKALKYFLNALELDPNDRSVVINIGQVCEVLGLLDQARQRYNPDDEVKRLLQRLDNFTGKHHSNSHKVSAKMSSMGLPKNTRVENTACNDTFKYDDSSAGRKRLLAICDLAAQPCSIGDFSNFVQATVVMGKNYSIDIVDIAFLSNPEHYTVPGLKNLFNKDNRYYQLFSILPIAQLNPNLGSVFIFDSDAHLSKFLNDNNVRYYLWPSVEQLNSKTYLHYEICRLLDEYYKLHGYIPYFSCPEAVLKWARGFYQQHVSPKIPITVNLRNNPLYALHRNSNIEVWLEFFDYCVNRYPVRFVVICGISEVDDRLRRRSNVIVAKDHHTGIEQDLALIQSSAMHLGAASGPATMAIYKDRPYLIVNSDVVNYIDLYYGSIILESEFLRFTFARPFQRIATVPETTELLVTEFTKMWDHFDADSWVSSNVGIEPVNAPLTWLR